MRHIIYILLTVLLVSCGERRTMTSQETGDTVRFKYATQLSVVKYKDYTEVVVKNPWKAGKILHRYCLVPDSINPQDISLTSTFVRTPLRRSVMFTTVHCAMLMSLGYEHSISGVADLKYIKIPWIHEQVKAGDAFFIPAGRVHALGPDIMVAEIQQTSDVTYRIYDWDRINEAGMSRELHIPQSVEAIDFGLPAQYKIEVPDVMNKTVPVVDCQYFVTNLLQLQGEMAKDYTNLDSFVILMPLEGFFTLNWENGAIFVNQGECVLIPNIIKKVTIRAERYCKLLEVYCQVTFDETDDDFAF